MKPDLGLTLATALLAGFAFLPVSDATAVVRVGGHDVVPDHLPCSPLGSCEPFGDGEGTCDEVRQDFGPFAVDQESGLGGQAYCAAGEAGFGDNADDGHDESHSCSSVAYSMMWNSYEAGCQPCTLADAATACTWVRAYIWKAYTYDPAICGEPTHDNWSCWGGGGKSYGRNILALAQVTLDVSMPGATGTVSCNTSPVGYRTPVEQAPAGDHCWNLWSSWSSGLHYALPDTQPACVQARVRMLLAPNAPPMMFNWQCP
jgi:hypothetical protein